MKRIKQNKLTPIGGIKVYEGALAVANKRGFKSAFLFFLLIKQISKSGVIYDYVEVIKSQTGLGKSKVYNALRVLEKLGLLHMRVNRFDKKYIQLLSTSHLYRYLGFNVSDCFDENEGLENVHVPMYRIGTCKNTKELELSIQKVEIQRNIYRQEKAIKEKFVHNQLSEKLGPDYKNQATANVIRRNRKITLRKLAASNKIHQLSSTVMFNDDVNINGVNLDATLSTQKTAQLFGYNSARTGTSIQRRLKESRFIDVTYRDEIVFSNTDYATFCSLNLPDNYYFIGGSIRRRLPNKITIL